MDDERDNTRWRTYNCTCGAEVTVCIHPGGRERFCQDCRYKRQMAYQQAWRERKRQERTVNGVV